MKHSTEIYIELYKRKQFNKIPVFEDETGLYYLSKPQIKTLEYLFDDTTFYVGYGGSGMCFTEDVLVRCIDGYKQIKDIIEGDLVLSYNKNADILEHKKVIKTFKFNCKQRDLLSFNSIKCTYGHKFLFRGKWSAIIDIARGIMGKDRGQLLHINKRENSYIKSFGERQVKTNETCKGHKWIFKNNDFNKWELQNNKNTQRSSKVIYRKSRSKEGSKSQEFYKRRQQGGEFRMVYEIRKYATFCKAWKVLYGWKTSCTAWIKKQSCKIDGRSSERNKIKIQTENIYTGNVRQRIWCFPFNNKRCYTKKVEAREINKRDFSSLRFISETSHVYDLCVEGNHSYTVSTDNIIVHNSGKTQLECFWLMFNCLAYPDTRWMAGRCELKNLKATTLQTLHKTFSFYGLKRDVDYKYNDQQSYYEFFNTSRIVCRDTKYYPSDPEMTELGGLEITGAVLDESVENKEIVINILTSRVNRWNNKKYGLSGKILEGFNPAKNHVHYRYWVPFRDNKETKDTKFVRALCTDNPHPDAKAWAENVLKTGDKRTIQRLYYGQFDYDDDDNSLMTFDKISDIFTNAFVEKEHENSQMYISSDLAITNDDFVIVVWKGLVIIDIVKVPNTSKTFAEVFNQIASQYNVPRSNIIYDADGIGHHLVNSLPGAIGIHNNSASPDKAYANLKTMLYYRLADYINSNKIYVKKQVDSQLKERIIDELQAVKRSSDIGAVLKLMPKDEVKKLIGHSPDISDAIAYRMLFVITRNK